MKRIRIVLLSGVLALLAAVLLLPAYSEGETPQSPQTQESESASSLSGETPEKPTGFAAFVNGYFSLAEGGGVVTRAFGVRREATIGELPAESLDVNPAVYIATLALMAIVSYVIGSVNFGIIVTKKSDDDVRNHGSGNSGMTNVLRVYGKKAAALTFLGDAGKAALCALIGTILAGYGCGYLAVAFCMVGHAYPVFFKFKGGKCVACAMGGLLVLEPAVALLLFTFFLLIVLATKYVSLGSMIAAALIPVFVSGAWSVFPWHNPTNFDYFIVCFSAVFYACIIVWLHRANIRRLYNGEERKLEFSKKNPKNEKNK